MKLHSDSFQLEHPRPGPYAYGLLPARTRLLLCNTTHTGFSLHTLWYQGELADPSELCHLGKKRSTEGPAVGAEKPGTSRSSPHLTREEAKVQRGKGLSPRPQVQLVIKPRLLSPALYPCGYLATPTVPEQAAAHTRSAQGRQALGRRSQSL